MAEIKNMTRIIWLSTDSMLQIGSGKLKAFWALRKHFVYVVYVYVAAL
jgi:hypothetical protein